MAFDSFIPSIWTAHLIVNYDAANVLSSPLCVNNDYSGEISGIGSEVTINRITDPSVGDYTRYQDITLEKLDFKGQKLKIDQQKYWGFEVDDIDDYQAAGESIGTATIRAAAKLASEADAYIGGLMVDGAEDKSTVLAKDYGFDAVYNAILDLSLVLDNKSIPAGRFLVVTPEIKHQLLRDPRFTVASGYGSAEPIQNGVIGSIAGFTVHVTNHLPKDDKTQAYKALMVAGHRDGTTMANQIVKTEALRHPGHFADVVRGLHVYGAKVVRPECLATATLATS
uniref:N4-gp56 family major capsid protein n=1 Tax=Streptomyces sp. NBC_00003 TaxID=2903608 RepID=A0AAU2VB12_9ACTN